MPMKPRQACSVPGCPRDAVTRGRCTEHQRQRDRERAKSGERGFDKAWRIIRDEYIAYHPKCSATDEAAMRDHKQFGDAATDVHHVRDYRDGGTDDWSNLVSLCHRCHSRETLRRMPRG